MTATHETLARPSSLSNAAAAIFAVLGLIDVALTGVIGSTDAPPLVVSLGVAALGLITLLALVPARRGSRGALIAIVVTRVISAVLAVPAFIFGWIFAASRAGRASGRLPRQVANCGVALGAAGLAGAVLIAASVAMPAHSLIQGITYGTGALASAPAVLAYPVWLIVLSGRLPGHLADRAGERTA